MQVWLMRPGISFSLTPADRRSLEALAGDRDAAQKHVWRAQIVLLSADGIGTNEIMRRTAKSKTCVWRWKERFAKAGSSEERREGKGWDSTYSSRWARSRKKKN